MIMKFRSFILSAVAAVLAFAACEPEKENLGTPKISISTSEMTFETATGSQELSVIATRDWNVEGVADWVSVSPESGEASSEAQKVTVTVLENTGMDREVDLKFTIGMDHKFLTVKQAGPGGSADALIIYANDFDGGKVEKITGSDGKTQYWPYLDQSDVWYNETGTGIANLQYTSNDVSIRSVSSTNNIFFPAAKAGACFSIQNLELGSATSLQLTFDASHGSTNGYKKAFSKDHFKVCVSKDNAKWAEIPYDVVVNADNEFDDATARFTVTGADKLSVGFVHPVATDDAYRLTNIVLSVYEGQDATAVDFSSAVAMDFGKVVVSGGDSGNTGGDSGNTGGDTGTTPDGAIFYESFASSIGNFTIDNKVLPSGVSEIWKYHGDYKCMLATAYVNSTNYASESWLISPEIDLTSVTEAYLSFDQACNFFSNVSTDVSNLPERATVLVSKVGGEWQTVTPKYPETLSWTFWPSGDIDLASFVGGKIKVAFKYSSTSEKAGSWEIKNVLVTSAKAEVPDTPATPEGTTLEIATNNTSLSWASDKHATYGDGFAAESGDVKIAFYRDKSTTALSQDNQLKADQIRVYKNNAFVITLKNGGEIKYVEMITQGGDYCNEYTTASGSVVKSGNSLIWSGTQTSPFEATMSGGQVRISKLKIVY